MKATLALIAVAFTLVAFVAADDHTHVNNDSSKDICATTSYWTNLPPLIQTGHSQFVNRRVAAHNSDVDEYSAVLGEVQVEIWVLYQGQTDCTKATGKHNTIHIGSDSSITLKDNPDGNGVDVYDAGTNNQLQPKAFTVYPAPSFACVTTNDDLPVGTRVATLQDVNNPNLDITKAGLSHDSIAELVDGWILGSDGKYATGSGDPSGNPNTHIGIFDPSLAAGFTEAGYDGVPTTADPNGALDKRGLSDEDLVVPPLQKRAGFSNYNAAMKADMQHLISLWTLSAVTDGKQMTYLSYNGYRIDQQLNGPVTRNGEQYVQLAVQAGSNLYAAVMVPFNSPVSAGGIRKALYQSLDDSTLHAFTRSARKSWRWTLVLAAAILLIA